MEYRTLENIDSICIYEAFTQAFSDYQVSVDMSFKSFETMLKRNGFMPAVSVGAFVDKTLVAFILNGVREWDNEKQSMTSEQELSLIFAEQESWGNY